MSAVEQTTTLAQLANEANANHRLVDAELKSAVQYAVRAGDALIAAKAALHHGQFGPWLDENFCATRRTAQAYMRVARGVSDGANAKRATHFGSIRTALAELADPKPATRPLTDAPWAASAHARSRRLLFVKLSTALRSRSRTVRLLCGVQRVCNRCDCVAATGGP